MDANIPTPKIESAKSRVTVYNNPEDVNTRAEQDLQTNQSGQINPEALYETKDASPEALEHTIEQTQERIADQIDELAKRLNPTHIKDQAVQSLEENLNLSGFKHLVQDVREGLTAGAKTSGSKILDGIKYNPLSSALIGTGVGVVALGGILAFRTDSSSSQAYRDDDKHTERLGGTMDATQKYDSSTDDHAGMGFSSMGQAAQQVRDTTMQGVHVAKDGVSRALEAQPLAIGAVALLAGAAIGLLLPRTSYEDSFMGARSDDLLTQAKGKASEVMNVAKSTATDVMQTAKDTAREVVQTTKDAAKEAVSV
ncbi:MAG: DUF3618 domain-containing protein [Trueperaceae bacterium]